MRTREGKSDEELNKINRKRLGLIFWYRPKTIVIAECILLIYLAKSRS